MAELLPGLHGKGSCLVLREMTGKQDDTLLPPVVLEARHLGPHCHHRFLAHLEGQRRIRAVKNSGPVARVIESEHQLHHKAL